MRTARLGMITMTSRAKFDDNVDFTRLPLHTTYHISTVIWFLYIKRQGATIPTRRQAHIDENLPSYRFKRPRRCHREHKVVWLIFLRMDEARASFRDIKEDRWFQERKSLSARRHSKNYGESKRCRPATSCSRHRLCESQRGWLRLRSRSRRYGFALSQACHVAGRQTRQQRYCVTPDLPGSRFIEASSLWFTSCRSYYSPRRAASLAYGARFLQNADHYWRRMLADAFYEFLSREDNFLRGAEYRAFPHATYRRNFTSTHHYTQYINDVASR